MFSSRHPEALEAMAKQANAKVVVQQICGKSMIDKLIVVKI